ncbi:MAG: zinc ribbon domain-containing protein [Nitrososphaerota archaeon]|nr:zinc ribbon domain-containing protein [Nitrososphaerota archaeon]
MSTDQSITRELSFSEVITKTFELYRNRFATYFIFFLAIEAVFAAVTAAIRQAASLPSLPSSPTAQQVSGWLSTNLGALAAATATVLVVALVVFPIAYGTTIRMASDEIQNKKPETGASIRFAASKLVSMWALGIIVGILLVLGLVALVVPGVILAIMFCLVFPALLLENAGIIRSMSRSRELVGHRWLKTFVTGLVLFIIIVIISAVLGAVSALFGPASSFASTILGAFTAPIIPIAMTVYYYSNLARFAPPPSGAAPSTQPIAPPGMKFCPNCGTQLAAAATFCSRCGAKQPA